jgi:hypothetical protein
MARPAQFSGDTIVVACKLPHGLRMRLFEMVDSQEAVAGGGFRMTKRAQPASDIVEIRGYLHDVKRSPVAMPSIGSSYALTDGINKDFFTKWLEQNADLDAVRNNLVFAHERDTAGQAREFKDTRSGVEPIDPNKAVMKPNANVTVGSYEKDKALG